MAVSEIPLSPENQRFSISVAGQSLQMAVTACCFLVSGYHGQYRGRPDKGIPLITGANLLAQYRYLGLGFSLYVNCDDPANDNPTQTDLGIKSHLYAVTE